MSEEQMYAVLALPAHTRAPLPDEEEERFLWYVANHAALALDLDLDPYAGSEWAGGVNCN